MNRKPFYFVIIMTIGSLVFSSVSLGLNSSNINVDYSGIIRSINLKKAAIIYNRFPLQSEETSIARHFELLGAEFGMPTSQMARLKALNPNLKVTGYKNIVLMRETYDDWAIVDAHEDWFIHDTNGERVRYGSPSSLHPILPYGMNPANTEWRKYFVDYVKAKIAAGNYDGVFLDDVWVGCYFQNVPPTHAATWYNDVLDFLQYIRANIGAGKIVMINSNEYYTPDSTYINATDAGMIEGFIHQDWTDTSINRPTELIMQMIDRLYIDSGNGRMLFCLSGTRPTTAQENERILKYSYSGYLLGINGKNAYWGFYLATNGHIDNWLFPSIMDLDVGQPLSPYYQSQSVYIRDFSEGKVLFNPSSNSYMVNLGGTYIVDGKEVSSLTIAPYSGEILLNQQ